MTARARENRATTSWWANRYVPPTPKQRAAGVVPSLARESGESLSAALSVLDEITSRIR